MKTTFTAPYNLVGVQTAIRQMLDRDGISEYEMAKRAGLSPTSVYLILRKSPNQKTRPVRRSTLIAIARGMGYEIRIDSVHRQLTFLKKAETLVAKTVIQEILDDVREVLNETDMRRLSKSERDRLKELIRVMVNK